MNNAPNPQQKRPQSSSRPGFERDASRAANPIPYTTEEQNRIQNQLNKVLGPEYVSFRPGGGGQNVSYIEGWKALNLANEIFGFNGWSSELVNIQVDFLDSLGSGRVSLGLSVVVRITIRDGTYHEDFGYGFLENAKNKAVAFEKCKKEAFTDGLKRCLRCFGNVLGNCLYDKTIVAKMQKVKLPPPELNSDDFHRDPLLAKQELARQRILRERTITSIPAVNNSKPTENSSSVEGNGGNNTNTKLTNEAENSLPSPHISSIPNGNSIKPEDTKTQTLIKAGSSNESAHSLTPLELKNYDLNDFDDSFVFSDDLPVDPEDLDESNGDIEMKDTIEKGAPNDENHIRDDSAQNHDNNADGDALKADNSLPAQVFFTSSKKALDVQKTPNSSEVPVYDHKFVAEGVKRTVDPTKSAKIRRADLPSPYTASQINSSRTSSANSTPSINKRQLGLPPSQRLQPKRLHREAVQVGKTNDE